MLIYCHWPNGLLLPKRLAHVAIDPKDLEQIPVEFTYNLRA